MYKQREKYRWFWSYLLILCIPISLCIALWFNMQILLNKERLFEGQLQTKDLMLHIETMVKENEMFARYFDHEPTLQKACALNELDDDTVLRELQTVIAHYTAGLNEEGNLYIYLRRLDLIVTAEGYYKPLDYWKQCYKESDIHFAQWKANIIKNIDVKYTVYSIPFQGQDGVVYQKLLNATRVQKQSDTNYAVVAFQNAEAFSGTSGAGNSYFVIYDENDELVYNSGNVAENMLPVLSKSKTDEVIKLGGKKYMISHETSEKMDFRYVVAVESYHALSQRILLAVIVCLMILCIWLCIWMLWKNSSKNYAVIERIVDRLRQTQQETVLADESSVIDSLIDNLVQENEDKDKLLFKQKNQLTNFHMSMLLSGHIQEFESAQEELLESERMLFLSDEYIVIVITLEDYSEFLGEDVQEETEKDVELVRFAIKNILSEFLGHQGDTMYFQSIEKTMTILFSVAPNHSSNAWEDVVERCEYIQEFLTEKLKIVISISVCHTAEGMKGIQAAYKKAVENAKYKTVFRKKVITPTDIEIFEDAGYGYTQEREAWLIDLLKSADVQSAEMLINDILELKDKQKVKNMQRLRHSAYCIAGTLLRFCEENGISAPESMKNQFLDSLMETEDLETMKQLIRDMVEKICAQDANKSKSLEMAQSVMRYIDNHYTDENLTVAAIAEQYRIHPTYLSNMFKKELNIGVLEYINRQRVMLATDLLLKTNDSVGSIAEKVGYINVNSFIRIFKKTMGTTPSKYRSVKKIINITKE